MALDWIQNMRLASLLPLVLLLPLQACISTAFHDTLLASRSSAPLPLGTIHVPPRDSGILLQGSLQVSRNLRTSVGVTPYLETPLVKQESQTSALGGRSDLQLPAWQLAGQGSLFLSDHVRLGAFADGTPERQAFLGEFGLRFGRTVSFEAFASAGTIFVQSAADWESRAHTTGCDSSLLQLGWGGSSSVHCEDDTASVRLSNRKSQDEVVLRVGAHLGARGSGPWIEAQAGAFTLLPTSPRADARWGLDVSSAAVGWSQVTTYGTATLALRATGLGGAFVPSLGVQWTGEVKLGG